MVIPIYKVFIILFGDSFYYLIYLGKDSIPKPLASLYLL